MLIKAYKSCSKQLSASATKYIYKEKNLHYIFPPLLSLPLKPELKPEPKPELEPEATPLPLISPY
jgi:hypothetical protein